MIVDSSVLLAAFFPDASQSRAQALLRDHVAGRIRLIAPDLLPYELSNSVWVAERRGHIRAAQAEEILRATAGLDMALEPVTWTAMLNLARKIGCSAYDAAYLGLAQVKSEPLVTGDLHLYNAAAEKFNFIQWIGDYPAG
jgi:predicted nucleic acid-binding protein